MCCRQRKSKEKKMKRPSFVLILCLISLAVVNCSENLTKAEKMEKLLTKFSNYLIEKNMFADCKDGYKYLMEAIHLAASETELPDEFTEHITRAGQIFKKTNLLNPEGAELLHAAYAIANGGEEFKIPAEINNGTNEEDYSRKSVRSAINNFKENHPEITVKLLMELAIMIVTPIEENPVSVKIVS